MVLALWDKVSELSKSAYQSNNLLSIDTSFNIVVEGELTFYIRVIDNLNRKQQSVATDNSALTRSHKPDAFNPFLPHEPALYVCDIGPHHKCLLNKFHVLDNHILIVSNTFEAQTSGLNLADFNALHDCLSQAPALAFYNAGLAAGASQQHKHIQLIKAPDPIEQLIAFSPQLSVLNDEVPRQLDSLPFRHAALALPMDMFSQEKCENGDGAVQLKLLYDRLRMTLSIEPIKENQLPAYNLLLTQEWMLMVPRTAESVAGLSLNALAFSGSILVKNETQAQQIINEGLTLALQSVS